MGRRVLLERTPTIDNELARVPCCKCASKFTAIEAEAHGHHKKKLAAFEDEFTKCENQQKKRIVGVESEIQKARLAGKLTEDSLEASKREMHELNVNLECFRKRVVEKTTELNKLRRGSSTAKTRLKIRFEAKIKSLEEELAKSLGKMDGWKKKCESLKGVSSLLANENRDLRSSQLKKKLDEAHGELEEAEG